MRSCYGWLVLAYLLMVTSLSSSVSAQILQPLNPLIIRVVTVATALPGETIPIFIEATFNGTLVNGALAGTLVFVWYVDSGQVKNQILYNRTRFATGRYVTNFAIPENATGVYWIQAEGSYRGFDATGVAGVTILRPIIESQDHVGGLGNLTSEVRSLGDTVNSLENMISTLTYIMFIVSAASLMLGLLAVALSVRKGSKVRVRPS